MAAIDWAAASAEATEHLQALLRLDTVNPPGNEVEAAKYLAGVVRREGLEPQIVESQPGRGNFVVRLASENPVGRPILLMGHTDTVSVEPDKWNRGPFSGELINGEIWGRGAVDMKGQVAAELTTLLLLKRASAKLNRDVILAAFADEEAGSVWGAKWMWEHRRDLIDAEYAINEGGGGRFELGGKTFYSCQAGEKGAARMRIWARAAPGHASVPLEDTAVARLGRALVKLHEFEPPTILTETVRAYLTALGDALGGDIQQRVGAVLADPSPATLKALPFNQQLQRSLLATTRNTAVPTILHGGHRINVIPSEVYCDVDGRILPGQSPEEFVAQVRAALGDEVTVEPLRLSPGLEADPASPFFDTIKAVMAEADPGAIVVPSLVSGGTDARALPETRTYGFMPTHTPEYDQYMHGHNERVLVDELAYAVRCFHSIVTRFAG